MNRLRPLTFFPPVVPPVPAPVGRLHRLAVDPPGERGRRVPGLDPDLLPDAGVDRVPRPGIPPLAEPGVDGGPGREVVGQQPPRPAGPQVVEDGVEHLAGVGGRPAAVAAPGPGGREERPDPLPLVVGQVRRVKLPCHAGQC